MPPEATKIAACSRGRPLLVDTAASTPVAFRVPRPLLPPRGSALPGAPADSLAVADRLPPSDDDLGVARPGGVPHAPVL